MSNDSINGLKSTISCESPIHEFHHRRNLIKKCKPIDTFTMNFIVSCMT